MYLLDTNVISEMMRPDPHRAVERWLSAHSDQSVFTTAISEAEIRFGIARLPEGRRRSQLSQAADDLFCTRLADRTLPFDQQAAIYYGKLRAMRESAGRPILPEDAMIAAIANAHRLKIVTRNSRDFEAMQLNVINPWES